jgi:hypothetical protein
MKTIRKSRSTKIVIDILMTVFVILSFLRWSGDSGFIFHVVVGTACALFFSLHLYLHWKWLRSVTKSLLGGKLNKKLRGKYAVNILLSAVWGTSIITGLLAVGYFFAEAENMAIFSRLHAITSRVGLALIIIHILQHLPQIKSYLGIERKTNS